MADHGAFGIRDERDREEPSPTQGADDELLGVTGVWRVQKRGNRHGLNCRKIRCGLISDPNIHGSGVRADPELRVLLLSLRPVIPPQRIKADSHPDHIERHRRPRIVIGAVDDESGGADDVHDLVQR